jgi:hypothetical protein
MHGINRKRDLSVTLPARALGDVVISLGDLQWIRITAGGEVERMPKPISSLCDVLPKEPRWCVAIVADCDRSMARARPCREVISHHVAIRTCARVVAQIRIPFGVYERIATHSDEETNTSSSEHRREPSGHIVMICRNAATEDSSMR